MRSPRAAGWRGGQARWLGLVAGLVVGVGLGPVGGVDGGDAAGAVQVEGAAAGEESSMAVRLPSAR